MLIPFLDTSGLVKRYVSEAGSNWVDALTDPSAGNPVYIARVAGVELVAAIVRRVRSGTIAAVDARTVLVNFRYDFISQYNIVEIEPDLIVHAMSLAEAYALRGYDAVQLAAALVVDAQCRAVGLQLTLVSADLELNGAATAEGLPVEDPNTHL